MAQGAQHLSEVKSNELERTCLGREEGAGLVVFLLPAAGKILINETKAASVST